MEIPVMTTIALRCSFQELLIGLVQVADVPSTIILHQCQDAIVVQGSANLTIKLRPVKPMNRLGNDYDRTFAIHYRETLCHTIEVINIQSRGSIFPCGLTHVSVWLNS